MFKLPKSILASKVALALVLVFLLPSNLSAQCAMCRAALESSGDGIQAEAVNDGIVYLMVIPYLLVAVIAIVIYKSRKQARQIK